MAVILRATGVCHDGFVYDVYELTHVQVLNGPNLNSIRGLSSANGNDRVEPVKDFEGDWILPVWYRDSPDSPFKDVQPIKNSNTKNAFIFEPVLDVNGNLIPCT